jgi:small subunit ribosomal protein S20
MEAMVGAGTIDDSRLWLYRDKPVSGDRSVANTPSARKRIRQAAKRAVLNKGRISRIRTFVRRVDAALAQADVEAAREAFRVAAPELQKGVTKGVVHANMAARKISRLARGIKRLEQAAS